tara:strand:+ start:369 stop:656 length:288 start_codon:yes stop_codon:yes gene_type:complete
MRLTKYASDAIIAIMESKGLNPKKCYFGIKQLENGTLGIGFTEEPEGKIIEFGKLCVTIADNINTENVVVDFGEVNGKRGLVFLSEEEYVNNQNQ